MRDVGIAEQEAKRFLARVKELKAAVSDADGSLWSNPKETGAVRRASMDLTRALSAMRKPS
jgi:hypothetical protein